MTDMSEEMVERVARELKAAADVAPSSTMAATLALTDDDWGFLAEAAISAMQSMPVKE